MDYILAGLFIVVLVFEYYQTRQFMGTIKHLVQVISDLKSFALGLPKPQDKLGEDRYRPEPPQHEDFGLGQMLSEAESVEEGQD